MGRQKHKPHRRPPKAGGGSVSAGPSRATSPMPPEPDFPASLGYAAGRGGRFHAPTPNFLDTGQSDDERGVVGRKRAKRDPSPAPPSRAPTPHGDNHRKARKTPHVPPAKPDNLPLAPWMQPHPFMRSDDTNAIYTDQWLAFADKAFPGDIMFLGSLLLTELWLANIMLPEELWDSLRAMVCKVLTAMYDEELSPVPPKVAQTTIQDLWTFLRRIRFSSMDKACDTANIVIVPTDGTDDNGMASEVPRYFKKQELKAKTVCRHLPTAAQRAKGMEANREADPPVEEAVDSVCWLVFFGARCAVSCNARTALDTCKCPHHVRIDFINADPTKVSLDDRFNLARSQAQVFFHAHLNMPVNSKGIGALNKKGIAYANKLVRRKSILSMKSLQLNGDDLKALASPSSKTASGERPFSWTLPSKGCATQAIELTAVASSKPPRTISFLDRKESSTQVKVEDKVQEEPLPGILNTGFVARATKRSKPKKALKIRKPLPFPKKTPQANTADEKKPEETNSEPLKTPVLEHTQDAPSKSSLLQPSPVSKPAPVVQPVHVSGEQVPDVPPPTSEALVRKARSVLVEKEKRPSSQVTVRPIRPAKKGVAAPVVPHFYKSAADPAEASANKPMPHLLPPVTSKPDQTIQPAKTLERGSPNKTSHRPAVDNVAPVNDEFRVPHQSQKVQIWTTYHVMEGGYNITLPRDAHFTELSEKWKAHIVSQTAKLPGSVIPPHQFMFLWKGRPLKLRETPAAVGMMWSEDVYVIDSMDASLGLRCHEAGLCNEVLRAIVCRDMFRMQRQLDPAPEGITLALEIGKRYEDNPVLRQEERKLAAEGRLYIPPKNGAPVRAVAQLRSVFDGTPLEELQARLKQRSSSQSLSGDSIKPTLAPKLRIPKTTEELVSHYQNSPARRLLVRAMVESSDSAAAQKALPRPQSLMLPRPSSMSQQVDTPVRMTLTETSEEASEKTTQRPKSAESPLRPFKLIANLPTADSARTVRSPPPPDAPLQSTPTKASKATTSGGPPAALFDSPSMPRTDYKANRYMAMPRYVPPPRETPEQDVFGTTVRIPTPRPSPRPSLKPLPAPSLKASQVKHQPPITPSPSATQTGTAKTAVNIPPPPKTATPPRPKAHDKALKRDIEQETSTTPRSAPSAPQNIVPGNIGPSRHELGSPFNRPPYNDPYSVITPGHFGAPPAYTDGDVYQPQQVPAKNPHEPAGWRGTLRNGLRNFWAK